MASKAGGGSTAARKRAKDQEMASRLKADEVKRESFRCPICCRVVPLNLAYPHLAYHPVG